MLIGQPTIDKVLPGFQQFIENTILVAHNAAFDMRFLQMKEEQTAVKIINPVLDTLLLSAVVHPSHSNHDLEAIRGARAVPAGEGALRHVDQGVGAALIGISAGVILAAFFDIIKWRQHLVSSS